LKRSHLPINRKKFKPDRDPDSEDNLARIDGVVLRLSKRNDWMKKKLKSGVTPGPFIESILFDRTRIEDPSHIIMSYPKALIYSFSDKGIAPIEYKQTEHYRVTRSFLESPERMLEHLFKEGP
jgi:hypothetical protein